MSSLKLEIKERYSSWISLKKTNVMTQILDYGLTTITLLPYCAETPFFVVILILKT